MWRTRALGVVATVLVVLIGGCTALPHYGSPSPRTYYLSARGDDSADGTSKDEAWRSLGRASQVTLRPGDRLLLEGGSRFAGTITIGDDEAGDADQPVIVDSYGSGRATVVATNSAGVSVHNTAGVEIHDLILRGRGSARTSQAGVNLYNDTPADARHAGVIVSDIDASGFQVGIGIGSTITGTGFADVTIRRALVHGNKDTGLLTYGPQFDDGRPSYAHENVAVEGVQSYDNPGDPNALYRPTGNGIVLGAVRDATVRNSSAHDNGTQAPAEAKYGPAGIWTYDSRDVLIEHSAAYRNHTGSRMDGAGFGLDSSVFDSTLQYNVSFENDGSGYYIFSRWPHPHSGNTVRYNITSNDARKMPEHGGMTIHGSKIRDLQVYQNTVLMGRSSQGEGTAVRVLPGNTSVSVRNNLIATDGDPLVVSDSDLSTGQVVFQGNQFYAAGGRWTVEWGDRRYGNLQSWREDTGQERLDGRPTGATASPCFDEGSLPDIESPSQARRVIPGCPHAGLDLQKHFGIVPVKVDYFGRVVTTPPNTGAAQP